MTRETRAAVQDHYPEDVAHCYGCGRLNDQGLQLKSRWEGDEVVARFTPAAYHKAVPGLVYGGLIASLIDCHAMGTAAAFAEREAGHAVGDRPAPRFVTASLHVDYRKPTPLGPELEVRGRVTELTEKKAVVALTLGPAGDVTAEGKVVAVRIPESMARFGR